MPRQIDADMSLDEIEDDILYTQAALQADPDAAELLPMTEAWLGMVDTTRARTRQARAAVANADAHRGVANVRLDNACTAFGMDLEHAVKKDRDSARYQQFFHGPVSRFVRQPLGDQAKLVKGWLDKSDDEILKLHKKTLQTWSTAADRALAETAETAIVRGQAWMAREQLAEDLTRARDGLHHALTGRAQERTLIRDWPQAFFRPETRRRRGAVELPTPPLNDTPSPIDG